jgi:hypothetical protein
LTNGENPVVRVEPSLLSWGWPSSPRIRSPEDVQRSAHLPLHTRPLQEAVWQGKPCFVHFHRSVVANPLISFRPRGSTTSAGFSVCGARRYCTPMPDEVHRVSVGAPLCLPASDSEESFHTNQGRPRFYRHSSARPFPRRMTPRRVSSSTAAPRHRGRCPLAIFRPQTQRAVTVASFSPKLPEEPPEGCPPLHPCSSLARFDSPSLAVLRASGCLTTGRCVAPGLCSVDEFVSPHARCRTRDV